jgi:hypothetical protein
LQHNEALHLIIVAMTNTMAVAYMAWQQMDIATALNCSKKYTKSEKYENIASLLL